MTIMQSKGWSCERCGTMIKGKCNNDNGYVTHINQCLSYASKKELRELFPTKKRKR